MTIDYGNGTTKYGPGVEIRLTGDDLVTWLAGIGLIALVLLGFDYGRDVYRWWRA